MYKDVTNPRQQQIDEIARIEGLPRPAKWIAAREFYLRLHPEVVPIEKDFIAAVTDFREKEALTQTGSSKGGHMRQTMKMPDYILRTLYLFDPELQPDQSSEKGDPVRLWKQLYEAFPMYRTARRY